MSTDHTPADIIDAEAQPSAPSETDTDATDWKAEAEKWKALSRKNENRATAALAEIDKAKQASMSEAEKALADAEKKGRDAATAEYGKQLAQARFHAAAAVKGIDLGAAADLIDTSRFVDNQGGIDADAIAAAVDALATLAPKTTAPARSGGEFSGGTGAGAPITEEHLARMSPEQIAKAHAEGKLTHLM